MNEAEYVAMFLTQNGLIIGMYDSAVEGGRTRINEPLMMKPQQGGEVSFSPMFTNEKWAIIPSSALEIECNPGFAKAYKQAAMETFTGIVMPTAQEKSTILSARG